MKRIQIDLPNATVALLLICACCTPAISQTRAPATAATPNVANTPQLATAPPTATGTTFELVVAGQSQGTFRSWSSGTATSFTPGQTSAATKKPPMVMFLSQGDAKANQYISSWYQAMLQGSAYARRNVNIIAHAASGAAVETMSLTNAYPIKLTISAVKSGATTPPDETLEISYEALSITYNK